MIDTLQEVRDEIDDRSMKWFEEAQEMGESHNAPLPSIPRCCGHQTQRDNVPGDSPEEYFCRTITIPFVDELLQHMQTRFSGLQSKVIEGLCLVPTMLKSLEANGNMDDFFEKCIRKTYLLNVPVKLSYIGGESPGNVLM